MSAQAAITTLVEQTDSSSRLATWAKPILRAPADARIAGRIAREVENREFQILEPQEGARFSEKLHVLMDWEGVVDEVRTEEFTARLLDRRSSSKMDTEYAEIPLTEVQADDRRLVQPGAIFYLTVYRVTNAVGQSERSTRLYFRRLPAWTRTMLASADKRAERWKRSFGVGKNVATSE
ncbi:MAG: hypothetical protein P4M07_28100 [Xanthobacteraceae bacterium]|nr:hypothetical protein [Xanthobacteraceae bacterium]